MKNIFFLSICLIILMYSCNGSNNTSNTEQQINTEKDTLVEVAENIEDNSKEEVIVEEEEEKAEVKEEVEKTTTKKAEKQSARSSKKEVNSREALNLTTSSEDFSKEYLMGKFNPNTHPDFVEIQSKHASRGGMKLRKDTYQAFKQMYDAAMEDGVRLKIISATRPFNHQKSIWEAKWNGKRKVNGQFLPANPRFPQERALLILMYSSMPGTSRHHWGTDIDLNDLNNPYFEKGQGKKIYDWLVANAADYGFCQVYSAFGNGRDNGYQEEKWHWSYVPVARRLTRLYEQKLTNEDISGFEGSETASSIDMINNYVLGINPDCK